MLIRFVVSNFLSFHEEREFNMIAASYKTHKQHLMKVGDLNILRASAIYGSNGAGKSNLVKAIEYFTGLIGIGSLRESINKKKFKLTNAPEEKPVTFELEFSVGVKTFSYGVVLDSLAVLEEWLYETGVSKKDKMIFERSSVNNKIQIKLPPHYIKTEKQKYLIELLQENLLKTSELLISKYSELNIEIIKEIHQYLTNSIVIIHPRSKYNEIVPNFSAIEGFRKFSNELIKSYDTGVNEFNIEEIDFDKFFGQQDEDLKSRVISAVDSDNECHVHTPAGIVLVTKLKEKLIVKKLVAKHKLQDRSINLDLDEESDGTQRLLDFISAFYGLFQDDITYIIDEIDQSLHPALLKAIIKKLMSSKNLKGQIVFTTHESNLLDLNILRPDEIWFAEKDKNFDTNLYSLDQYKPRYDLDIRKGYLMGRFGAIPFLANLEELNW